MLRVKDLNSNYLDFVVGTESRDLLSVENFSNSLKALNSFLRTFLTAMSAFSRFCLNPEPTNTLCASKPSLIA
jgi:hypothetical protein